MAHKLVFTKTPANPGPPQAAVPGAGVSIPHNGTKLPDSPHKVKHSPVLKTHQSAVSDNDADD